MAHERTPVLIAGGGPVGLALSIDLSWRGIPHILVERDGRAARGSHPRMDQVGVRSMEHFRRLGIVSEVEAAGFPRDFRRDVVFATGVLGMELAREPFEADATRPAPPFSPQKHELCPQNFLDPALQLVAERATTADIRYQTRLLAIEDRGDYVSCTLDGGHVIEAQYLAGCDGSGSAVAEHLGANALEVKTLARSTNLFIHAPELRHKASGPGAYRYILIGPNGVWASMVNMDGRDTWRLQVLGDAERPAWSESDARLAVDRAIGGAVEYELASIVPWIRRELIVDRFSDGRCFLVGDAAHQFSPTGGYGMNTGLGEAFNLSWKLAATIDRWGGPDLLASYAAERRPVAVRNAQRATQNFERMRGLRHDPALHLPLTNEAAMRRAGVIIRERMNEEWESMGIHLGYSYAGSPIVVDEDPPGRHAHPVHYEQSAAPGARAPHAWLAYGRSTLDLFGRGFVLLQFGSGEAPSTEFPLQCERIDDPAVAALYERRFVLVRPDGHVSWRGDEPPGADVLDRVRGAGARVTRRETADTTA